MIALQTKKQSKYPAKLVVQISMDSEEEDQQPFALTNFSSKVGKKETSSTVT